jgi:phage tail protein X
MLREMAVRDPQIKGVKPEEFVNLNFVRELDGSGFIDRLYKAQPVLASRGELFSATTVGAKDKPARPEVNTRSARTEALPGGATTISAGAYEYTVEAGDTLTYLARKYYGDHLKWQKIYEANKETMKNPNYIYVGQKIIIPQG